MSIDDLLCACDVNGMECDACDEDFSFARCPFAEEDERCIDRQKDMINSFAYIPLEYRINCPLWYPKKE